MKIGSVCERHSKSLRTYNGLHPHAWKSLVLGQCTHIISPKVAKVYFEVSAYFDLSYPS